MRPESRGALAEEELTELRDRVLRAVRRSCPPWLASRAEDICQEALIKLAAACHRGGERAGGLSPSYIKKAAYHAVIDAIRSHGPRRQRESPMQESVEAAKEAAPATPERAAAGREIGLAIRGCLEGLVRPRRVAVILHLQGHTLAESSRLLGWPETKTTNLVYRGLKDMRRCLGQKGLTP